ATEACGNSNTASQTIAVTDNTPPVLACPADIVKNTDPNQCSAVVNFTVTATDTCDPNPQLVCVPPTGAAFPVGNTPVICTATDKCSNTGTCSFTVTVNASLLASITAS